MGTVVYGMDGDGDDLENSCGDMGGDGIRVPGMVGMGINICSRAAL